MSDLIGPRFEAQTSRSRDERVTARPTGRWVKPVESVQSVASNHKSITSILLQRGHALASLLERMLLIAHPLV